ncbi:probable ubiquitin carboxyl-terminal hydrolase FAF-X isoform X2 [Actinia tenebrosa]|uniref:ubiquitinyl hydrolase 1 n=1 Tax=Actinia tenebrosa TaxID=6105 RepID=A0A6P8H0M9_ACTTE|nr:probable ubiquitin carboxyl-terminal hydrolase FAF-X isoform X2 [Actinia tenebrosa]
MTVSVKGGGQGEQTPPNPPATTPKNAEPSAPATSGEEQPPNENELAQQDNELAENNELLLPSGEPFFPVAELAKLDEMINRQRWVVPVLPKGELEVLLEASIKLCKAGLDTKSEDCQRFFRDGLTLSFHKILNDEAVNGWKYEIHKCILKNTEKLIELCVVKLPQDWFPLLDLLSLVFNPLSRFNDYNGARPSETLSQGTSSSSTNTSDNNTEVYAKSPETGPPKGWLVDLVNRFGSLGGFGILQDRVCSKDNLNVPLLSALLKPFGYCAEVLTTQTVEKYFLPIIKFVPDFLEGLSDEELKKEAKNEAKNDALSSIIKALKKLGTRIEDREDIRKQLEIFRLKMILRLLQISSFNGKMNALNEINKVISSVSYYTHPHTAVDDKEWLTAERMAEWIESNNVLSIVLKDNLHQPQYVEKLEKIIRFIIKEKALSLKDLDSIWAAQIGKHDAIIKNIHDLLAKLAWDFSADQLDHLFSCFQESWAHASKKQREKLLELIRRLAEDDKEGVMAHKVLGLLWSLTHSDDVPTDIMDLALSAHIKILDYSCSQDRDSQKTQWIDRCVEELRNDTWVLPALKHIKEICMLFYEAPQNYSHVQRNPHVFYRHEVINKLQQTHSLVTLVADNLAKYMQKVRVIVTGKPEMDSQDVIPDGRYNHQQQVQDRLNFLKFLLKDGQLWLCEPQAKLIWQCLAEKAIYPTDRECCFKWFSKLMGDEPDLDPDISLSFFEGNVLKLDPVYLTENGIRCFERFFRAVNVKEGKLVSKRRSYMMEDLNLIGIDYVWKVVLHSSGEIAHRAIELLKETFTNLGPNLRANQVEIHDQFIQACTSRIRESAKVLLTSSKGIEEDIKIEKSKAMAEGEAIKVVRCLTVLREYVSECDDDHMEERAILPHGRSCRGKHVSLIIRFPAHGRQGEEFEIWSHAHESLASIRRQILGRIRPTTQASKIDLYVNGELLCPSDDRRLVFQVPLRDRTLITAKIGPVSNSMPSSPDSSSESSTGSTAAALDGPNLDAENCLPGVIMSKRHQFLQYLIQLADHGIEHGISELRERVQQLLDLIPSDAHIVKQVKSICHDHADQGSKDSLQNLEKIFLTKSPMQALYNLEVVYALIMPACPLIQEQVFDFQLNFLKSGGMPCVISMLTNTEYVKTADMYTKRSAYNTLMKLSKLLFTVIGHAQVNIVAEAMNSSDPSAQMPFSASVHNAAVVLQQALMYIPNPNTECMLKNVAVRLAIKMGEAATTSVPDLTVIKSIQRIAWVSGGGVLRLLEGSNDEIHKAYEKPGTGKILDQSDAELAREALEVLTVCLALCPSALDSLSKDKTWQCFVIDVLILCQSRSVRYSAADQFFLMATRCSNGHRPIVFFITLLFTVLMNTVKEHPLHSHHYFNLLCRLLSHAYMTHCPLSTTEVLLKNEIGWLKKTKEAVLAADEGDTVVDETLLEGHLGITRELLLFQDSHNKLVIGSQSGGPSLIKELIEDFIFPASKIVLEAKNGNNDIWNRRVTSICSTPPTLVAGFDLLVSLCSGCLENLRLLSDILTDMYYSDDTVVTEWEHLPPIGPRPHNGFVGLKNAGATCYMNSVIQQLFMIPELRKGVLLVEGAVSDEDEELVHLEEKSESESTVDTGYQSEESRENDSENKEKDKAQERKEYQIGVLRQIQFIFGHLAHSQLQFHIPKGFWNTFKLFGEPVNLREQHDALEFFNNLVDNLDEGLKFLGHEPIFSKVLGGAFADQKICKGCPHRYSREAPFIALNVDIRNHQSLTDSMEQFVKGDLLEGANAYHCEKCNKKVDTVKRMCISRLPRIMAIQLKRFDYDWERECAVKFNDYFEFPREIDMEPFTEIGLAKSEGEVTSEELIIEDDKRSCNSENKYRLTGILVHSGQASGGHYYCYILQRSNPEDESRWYKFDDGEVSECKMEDDEEMKNQCFGGEYMGEVFDHMLKRMSYRRQKRWWNAYILFYERLDVIELNTMMETEKPLKVPVPIERAVRKQNVHFLHNRIQFSPEYFQFIRKLTTANAGQDNGPDSLELGMISIKLLSRFLFSTGFHTKKIVRGPANEWYDAVCVLLRSDAAIRLWFGELLFTHPERFSEYLLESPTAEVRSAFAKILVFLAHHSLQDGPCGPLPGIPEGAVHNQAGLSEYILIAVLNLLKKEVPEHGRHVQQYFQFFLMYAGLGPQEKIQLLKLNVPATFMLVAIDEGPGPSIRFAELGKLYAVVSQLLRSCDVSVRTQSSTGSVPFPNPFGDGQPLMEVPTDVSEILFNKLLYLKKLIEDTASSEETIRLLKFCCWENPHFSRAVLSELLWQVAYSYTYELRPYFDLLLQMLLVNDSWQSHRIHNTLRGIPDDRDGLFDIIQRSKNHYQKRAYQCMKFMVALFNNCSLAHQILLGSPDLRRKWNWAVEWLGDELHRRPYPGGASYTYNNWSPPAQSNETSNGYFLERSNSARLTLAKACELCPEEEPEEEAEHEVSPDESQDQPLDEQEPISKPQQPSNEDPPPFSGDPPPPPDDAAPPTEEVVDEEKSPKEMPNNEVTD